MSLRLFLLATNPDRTGYCVRLLVRAMSTDGARRLASQKAGEEGRDVWLHLDDSTCLEARCEEASVGVLLREEGKQP